MTSPSPTRRAFARAAGAGLLALAAPASGSAAAWPTRPLRWVVPYPPGGGTDLVARTIAAAIAPGLGQPVVVENRPGAASIIAAEAVAKAPPDGHTLMSADMGTLVYNAALYRQLPYDPARDLRPVSLTARFHFALVVTPGLAARSLDDLLAMARREPGALTMASPGIGSPHHLALERLQRAAGIRVTHVPYRGGAPAVQDLVAGQVQAMFIDLASGRAALEAGRIRALAVASGTRQPGLEAVPTLAEAGLPAFEVHSWQGVVVPAATPEGPVNALGAAIASAAAVPALRARLAAAGVEVLSSTPADYVALIQREAAVWIPLIRELGLTVEG